MTRSNDALLLLPCVFTYLVSVVVEFFDSRCTGAPGIGIYLPACLRGEDKTPRGLEHTWKAIRHRAIPRGIKLAVNVKQACHAATSMRYFGVSFLAKMVCWITMSNCEEKMAPHDGLHV